MKILITGTEGQLALSLLSARRDNDITVVSIGRPDLDLTVPETIQAAFEREQPDIVVNAAAYTAVDKAESEPDLAYSVNAVAPGYMARMCDHLGAAFIHISTDYVFDGSKTSAYVEDDATGPTGVYGYTKLEGERLVRDACNRHLILRTAWVHSPYGQNFVKTMLHVGAARPELSVVDDQSGCPTYAPHLADAILKIAAQAGTDTPNSSRWGTYHACGHGDTTWCGLAREVFRIAKQTGGPYPSVKAITTAEYPTPARRPANSRLDCGKLEGTFGVTLPPWETGVQSCVGALLKPSVY